MQPAPALVPCKGPVSSVATKRGMLAMAEELGLFRILISGFSSWAYVVGNCSLLGGLAKWLKGLLWSN